MEAFNEKSMTSKKYIASYIDKSDRCCDVSISANSWREAHRDAWRMQKEFGKLYSVRLSIKSRLN